MGRRYPAQLSGGQRQRVGVARALAADPPVMLMDEPFGAIDPINRERLQNEFLRLQAELRKTIVFVTHDIDEAIKMGDRIAVMQEGGILAQYAPPAELLMHPANAVRRGLRGRRPRAQAARAAARARRRAAAAATTAPDGPDDRGSTRCCATRSATLLAHEVQYGAGGRRGAAGSSACCRSSCCRTRSPDAAETSDSVTA